MSSVRRKPAFGYLRRSKEDETGNSMAAQERAIRDKFEPQGYEFIGWFRDEHSAFRHSDARYGITQMFQALEDHPEVLHVCVEQPDRLSRDPDHMGYIRFTLKQRKVQVHYVLSDYDTTTPDGIMMYQMTNGRSAASSMENSQKTHSRMIANFLQRDPETGWLLKNGGRPQFGYRIVQVKHLVNSKKKARSVWELDEANSHLSKELSSTCASVVT